MAKSALGRRRRELEGLIKSAAADYRRYVRECAKHEIKAAHAEKMKAVCKVSLEDFRTLLDELPTNT